MMKEVNVDDIFHNKASENAYSQHVHNFNLPTTLHRRSSSRSPDWRISDRGCQFAIKFNRGKAEGIGTCADKWVWRSDRIHVRRAAGESGNRRRTRHKLMCKWARFPVWSWFRSNYCQYRPMSLSFRSHLRAVFSRSAMWLKDYLQMLTVMPVPIQLKYFRKENSNFINIFSFCKIIKTKINYMIVITFK